MFFSSKKGKLSLLLDVQSSIIRGTLVHFRENDVPLVLYSHNVVIPYKSHARSGYLIKSAIKGISEVVNDILKHLHTRSRVENIPRKISEVNFVLSSPWIISQSKILSSSFNKDTEVNPDFIGDIISKERTKIVPKGNNDLVVIEEKVFDVRLNGYSVSTWNNTKTRELEVLFVFSVAGKKIIDRFIEICDHVVSQRSSIRFHSSLFLQHISILKLFPDKTSYALVHIHGELTDVAIIHQQACSFLGSYPFGVMTIVRTLAREMKIDEKSAESILNMWVLGHLDSTHAKIQSIIIENMKNGWTGEFRKMLNSSHEIVTIPKQVIISAHSHEDFFVKSFLSMNPSSNIQLLDLDDVLLHIEFDAHAERHRLSGLYVKAIHSL